MALAGRGARATIYLDVDDDGVTTGLRSASQQLGRYSRSIAAQDSQTKRANTTSSRFAQTTSRLGGSLSSVARYAAGAAAAYLSISQVKAAVTSTVMASSGLGLATVMLPVTSKLLSVAVGSTVTS